MGDGGWNEPSPPPGQSVSVRGKHPPRENRMGGPVGFGGRVWPTAVGSSAGS